MNQVLHLLQVYEHGRFLEIGPGGVIFVKTLQIGISPGDLAHNKGDEAIVMAMIAELQRRGHRVRVVFSRDPARTERRLGVAAAPVVPTAAHGSRVLHQLDLLLWGGGHLIHDHSSALYLPYFSLRAIQALRRRIPVALLAVGAAPIRRRSTQRLARYLVSRCHLRTVRDEDALTALRECGIESEVLVTADPAFLLSASGSPKPQPKHVVVFAVREWFVHDHRLLPRSFLMRSGFRRSSDRSRALSSMYAEAADRLVEMGLEVTFVAMSTGFGNNDLTIACEIVAKMRQAANVLDDDLTVPELLQIFARANVVVAMRMHAAILTLVAGSRPLMITYSAKGETMANRMGLQGFALRIERCTADLLVQKVRDALVADRSLDLHLEAETGRMRLEALRTFDLIDNLAARLPGRL